MRGPRRTDDASAPLLVVRGGFPVAPGRAKMRGTLPETAPWRRTCPMTVIVTLPKPPVRPLFAALLPAAFALGCLFGALWPGHGGQLFGIGAFVGAWAPLLLHGAGDASRACWLCCFAGAPVLWVFGRMLDRLRIELSVWLIAFALVATASGYALLQWDGDLDVTLARHGSLWAVVVCAGQLGIHGATLLALALGAGRGVTA